MNPSLKPCVDCRWHHQTMQVRPTEAGDFRCRRPDETDAATLVTGEGRVLDRPCLRERDPKYQPRGYEIPPSRCEPHGRYFVPLTLCREARAAQASGGPGVRFARVVGRVTAGEPVDIVDVFGGALVLGPGLGDGIPLAGSDLRPGSIAVERSPNVWVAEGAP